MIDCLRELHECKVVHRDLAPSNFVNCNGQMKVIDFGAAEFLSKNEDFRSKNNNNNNYKRKKERISLAQRSYQGTIVFAAYDILKSLRDDAM